jgi:hypothetical protein
MQPQELLDCCEYTIKYQMAEIDRLRAELERRDDELNRLLEWINAGDALTGSCSEPISIPRLPRLIASRPRQVP